MKTSNEMCDRLIALMRQNGMQCKLVNGDFVDEDSMCEHQVDVDVVTGGWIWNVRINVVRFARDEGQF